MDNGNENLFSITLNEEEQVINEPSLDDLAFYEECLIEPEASYDKYKDIITTSKGLVGEKACLHV